MTPDGWNKCTLGDFCFQVSERAGKRDLPVLSVSKDLGIVLQSEKFKKRVASADISNYKCIQRGQFAYDPMLLWAGNVGRQLCVDTGVVSPAYTVFDVNSDIEATFLEKVLKDPRMLSVYRNVSRGTNVRRQKVLFSDFASIRLLVPPLPEQRKIAAILSTVDDVIEKTEAMIDSLQTIQKAVTQELLTCGLPGRHSRFKRTAIGEIPENWATVRCGELFDVQLGKMISPIARGRASQFPYLRNQNVHWDRFDLTDVATMHFDERERQKFKLEPGDLLACEGRHIGRCAVWNGTIQECYYQKALHRLRPKSDRITTHYMQHFMTLRFRHQGDLVSQVRTSTTIPHLPLEQLLALPVVLPPRAEQDEITQRLSLLRSRQQAEEASMDALCALKDALMSALLTGELRVTPNEYVA